MLILDKNYGGQLSRNIDDYPEGIVVLVDKPYRWTSADVIRKLKFSAIRHFGKRNLKVGHAGTLDPLASGVLVVCIGAACRKAETIQAGDKEYVASVCFGATTASYDREKPVDNFCPSDGVNRASLEAVLPLMCGRQDQLAPLFSAKQVDGVRAYEMARRLYSQGKALDEAAAELLHFSHINIMETQLLDFSQTPPESEAIQAGISPCSSQDGADRRSGNASSRIMVCNVPPGLPLAQIRIACSKGTYIRSFARDLGEKLESGAFLYGLRRTACGEFRVENALSVETCLSFLKF